jgi:hypothetical protein
MRYKYSNDLKSSKLRLPLKAKNAHGGELFPRMQSGRRTQAAHHLADSLFAFYIVLVNGNPKDEGSGAKLSYPQTNMQNISPKVIIIHSSARAPLGPLHKYISINFFIA